MAPRYEPQSPHAFELPRVSPASADEASGDAGTRAKRTVAALLRYKWLILAIVVVSAVGGFSIRGLFSAVYEADGKVWIAQAGTGSQTQGGPMRADALLPANSNSWGDLVTSDAVLEKTVRELHLFIRPLKPWDDELFTSAEATDSIQPGGYVLRVDPTGARYTLSATDGRTERLIEQGAVGDSIGRKIGLRWAPDTNHVPRLRTVSFSLTTPRQAALHVKAHVASIRPNEANVLRISVTSNDGRRAARTVNSLERQLVQTAGDFKRRNLTDVRQTLEVQAAYAAKALHTADDALERFRTETITLPSEGGTPVNGGTAASGNPVVSNFFNLKLTRENVAQERGALEQTLQGVAAGKLDVQALWQVLPASGGSQDVGALLQEYAKKQSDLRNQLSAFTEDYQGVKDTRAALAQLRDHAIPSLVTSLIEQLKRQETGLGGQIDSASTNLQSIPGRTIEEVRLTRNVDARTQLYGMLQSRYEEARLAELSVEPDLSILDSASTPEYPLSSPGHKIFFMAAFGGLAAALALALVLDRFDKRIRYMQQIPSQLGLNVVGAVPRVGRRGELNPMMVAQLVESFRSLRLGVTYAIPNERPLKLTVTSAGASDGKSLVSGNLALAFAESGYRTLLIDGDVRRGKLHTMFNTERRPGLVEVLRGANTLAECSRATTHPNLSLLSCGARLKIAPELLASKSFRDLMDKVQSEYDVVLIDSPPLAAGMDPHALCVAGGNVLFVVRLAQSNGEFVRQKLDMLERFPVRLIGAVANDVTASVGLNAEYAYLPTYAIHEEDTLLETPAVTALD